MLQNLTSPFKEFGFFGGLLYAVDRVLVRISPRLRLYVYELMVQPIPEHPLLPDRLTKNLVIREIKRGDPEVDLMPARPEIKESRFAQNAICLGAFKKGKFIGYMWFCFRTYEEDEVRCTYVVTPPDEAVFDFDLYLFPEYRMGLGFIGIWNGANKFLRERGIKFTFSRLTRFNLASRRAHHHLGWKLVGRVVFLQAWRLEFMMATLFPFLHLSLGKPGSARLELRPDSLLT
ncbi:MAG: GNAT family N-acetyltransferase [Betaproteobacteria bacterium]|nr:GNAT family N-acetyltransferase [Betaproteobacteria bacterium]